MRISLEIESEGMFYTKDTYDLNLTDVIEMAKQIKRNSNKKLRIVVEYNNGFYDIIPL